MIADSEDDSEISTSKEHETFIPLLSDYAKKLENHVKRRYIEKISVVGIDPATLWHAKLEPECLPPIEAMDLLSYLVLDTSYYTKDQFKAFKSLDAYNQMVSGFITSVQGKIIAEKYVVIAKAEFDVIESPTGWLDCTIIQQAQILLKKVNPMIEGFQRTTLGPVRNFDVVTSEFVQILHSGNHHWVCTSSVGCLPGIVNLYDSLFHDIIVTEVEQQVKDLMANSFAGINIVPVQQQGNGSDCGVFAIAFATCIVFGLDPSKVTFNIPLMRPHLSRCLKAGVLTPFCQI